MLALLSLRCVYESVRRRGVEYECVRVRQCAYVCVSLFRFSLFLFRLSREAIARAARREDRCARAQATERERCRRRTEQKGTAGVSDSLSALARRDAVVLFPSAVLTLAMRAWELAYGAQITTPRQSPLGTPLQAARHVGSGDSFFLYSLSRARERERCEHSRVTASKISSFTPSLPAIGILHVLQVWQMHW